MKFTLEWLKEHLDTDAGLEEIAERLTAIGLEVEEIADRAGELAAFVTARVVEAKPHPNADKLQLCIVDTGSEQVQVVCGAPNARTDMKGVFAPSGTTIPGTGLHLKKAKIRGEESNGMLCSEREMGLSDDHEGIIELPEDTPIGVPFAEILGLNDPVFEIGITPNRQDCLGVHGIARDLAAAGLGVLKPLAIEAVAGTFSSPIDVVVDSESIEPAPCTMFVGRYIRGVKNGTSPKWLQDRLTAIGLRPISALVDMTNFYTFDVGRPLHVFDADTVNGNIHVRLSHRGEKLLALDGREYETDDTVTVISDDSGILGFGGVIGGEPSGCTEETVNVFIEAALFDPIRTAATGRKLQIESDARYRFERGVDPDFVVAGMELATRMVLDICGGVASDLVVSGSAPEWQREVELRPGRIRALGGVDVPTKEITKILTALGFQVTEQKEGNLVVMAPPWRTDIDGEADLVEEVVRIKGYDLIPPVPLPRETPVTRPVLSAGQRRRAAARRTLAARGMVEAVTFSFVSKRTVELFGDVADSLILANPISSDLDAMRPSVLPNLVAAAARNHDRGADGTALFELGPIYIDDTPEGQSQVAGGVRTGVAVSRDWRNRACDVDVFDAKADAAAALEACGFVAGNAQIMTQAPDWYHPGRSGVFKLGSKKTLAHFGELHPGVLQRLDIKVPVVAFELFLDEIPLPKARGRHSRPKLELADLPAVERDFAFVVDNDTPAAKVLAAVRGANKALISDVSIFDIYSGEGIDAGKKSIAFSVRLQPIEKTMAEAEIDAVAADIVAAVTKTTGGTLRG